jgi:hypothetical protein
MLTVAQHHPVTHSFFQISRQLGSRFPGRISRPLIVDGTTLK